MIGANLKSPEGFGLVINFVMWPMFFFSNALFTLVNIPAWLTTLTYINPMTYGVDAVRGIILGINHFPFYLDISVMLIFSAIMMVLGVLSFRKM
ncbi:ABC-2 type transporter [uncultured archaeon]|nr:ABC-2 type transporter [uncultured archaeon]